MELAEKQLQEFSDQGFVNVGRIFDERQLATISAEYDRLVTQEAQVLGNEKDGFFPYRAMLNFRSQELAKFILHPPLVAMARQILGDEIRFWWDQGINKRPGSRSPIRWHQDNGYQRGRTQEFLTCWLALDASDLRNGGLEVIPGSHKGGQRLHGWEGVHAVIPGEGLDASPSVGLDAGRGEMLIFSSLLVHQTPGNHTLDRERRAWVIQYCRGDQYNEVTGEVYDDRPWVMSGGKIVDALRSERPFNLGRERA
jgi:ectoine hydroxylase-related dioxygenase (phytanoyl-CoA dioxygenase family)